MIRRLAALIVASVALAAPIAQAAPAPFTPAMEADYAYAAEWWGAPEPTGCWGVERLAVTAAELPPNVLGRATQPEDELVDCTIEVRDDLVACTQREVMLHEYGHLLGHGHSTDPTNIMYPQLVGTIICPPPPPPVPVAAAPPHGPTDFQLRELAQLRYGLARIRARCVDPPPRKRWSCRHLISEWRAMIRESVAAL